MIITLELTGNEARAIFYAIKNKKSQVAENLRKKIIDASNKNFLKTQHKNNGTSCNSYRSEEG